MLFWGAQVTIWIFLGTFGISSSSFQMIVCLSSPNTFIIFVNISGLMPLKDNILPRLKNITPFFALSIISCKFCKIKSTHSLIILFIICECVLVKQEDECADGKKLPLILVTNDDGHALWQSLPVYKYRKMINIDNIVARIGKTVILFMTYDVSQGDKCADRKK